MKISQTPNIGRMQSPVDFQPYKPEHLCLLLQCQVGLGLLSPQYLYLRDNYSREVIIILLINRIAIKCCENGEEVNTQVLVYAKT